MRELIDAFMAENKIKYYGVLDYADCTVTAERIMKREGFVPMSVIVYLLPYYAGEAENLSVYAASLDYHKKLGEIGEGLIARLKATRPDLGAKSYGDHSPIDEVTAAASLGLGVLGEHTLLINPEYGSYVFIGDVITDIPPEELGAEKPSERERCISCGACAKVCPSGILRGECDACLSGITQRKGELTEDEIAMMMRVGTVWGCDECQRVCPMNKGARPTELDYFYEDRITRLDKEALDGMTDEELKGRAFGWRGRGVLLRNLAYLYPEE